ncbi:MAG: hypothetical protein FJ298_08060 [Planctomycetes bacterium]|nr:hypothetical protein [Planctomycetota bacterium]
MTRNLLSALALCALLACGEPADGGAARETALSVETVDMAGLEAALAARRGRPLVLNFWALW